MGEGKSPGLEVAGALLWENKANVREERVQIHGELAALEMARAFPVQLQSDVKLCLSWLSSTRDSAQQEGSIVQASPGS